MRYGSGNSNRVAAENLGISQIAKAENGYEVLANATTTF